MKPSAVLVRSDLAEYLRRSKSEIGRVLADHFARKKLEFEALRAWGPDVALRLHEFAESGKMIRGGLVLLAADLFGRRRDGEELKLAAAVELIQSALLVHDDIMDRDLVRRGRESVHAQYASLGRIRGLPEPLHFGESMGICAGDIAIFTAFELLGALRLEGALQSRITSLLSKEMTSVGVAQMQDIYFGESSEEVSEQDVYTLYLFKTGRYTFSLPLMLGGLLAGAPPLTVDALARLGEHLGILFQIKDDEIGLFGDSSATGKPCGSDVAAAKKTLFHLRLMREASPAQRERLSSIFGSREAGAREIGYVRKLVEALGIRERLSAEMSRLAAGAHAIVESIDGVDPERRELLRELVDFNLMRSA